MVAIVLLVIAVVCVVVVFPEALLAFAAADGLMAGLATAEQHRSEATAVLTSAARIALERQQDVTSTQACDTRSSR